jgi:hypothetical protein
MARTVLVASGFTLSVLVLWGCSSDSLLKPGDYADAGADGPRVAADAAVEVQRIGDTPGTADGPAVEVQRIGATDTASVPETGSVDVSGVDGSRQDSGVCQSPLSFPSNSQLPSMCPGVVLKTAVIPFVPTDSRWSSLYQSCLQSDGPKFYQDACRQLCSAVADASPAMKYNQGITSCSLDCSQPDNPVLSVIYSDTICEPSILDARVETESRPDARLDGAPDASIDSVRVDAPDGVPDAKMGLDALDGGSLPQVALRDVSTYGNCMPLIAADPIITLWTVDISGARGASAQLTSATITVSKGTSIVQSFTVANPTIPLVDGAGSASQRKPHETVLPNQACSSMCNGATYQLDLVFEVDGQSIALSKSGAFLCAY